MRNVKRCGQTLVGVLISVFVMIALAVFFLMPRGGINGAPGKTVLKRSIEKGQGVASISYLSQIRQGITMYKDSNDGKPPASLDELKHYLKDYPPECWVNPVDQKPFLYDPATGTICEQGPGCPATDSAAPVANPPAPGANPPAPAPPSSPTGPGGIHMNIPAPGAGAADAMRDN